MTKPRQTSLDEHLPAYSKRAAARLNTQRSWTTKKRWLARTAVAGASMAMPAAVDAAIVYSGPQNVQLNATGTSSNFIEFLDLNGDNINDVQLELIRGNSTFTTTGVLLLRSMRLCA